MKHNITAFRKRDIRLCDNIWQHLTHQKISDTIWIYLQLSGTISNRAILVGTTWCLLEYIYVARYYNFQTFCPWIDNLYDFINRASPRGAFAPKICEFSWKTFCRSRTTYSLVRHCQVPKKQKLLEKFNFDTFQIFHAYLKFYSWVWLTKICVYPLKVENCLLTIMT